MKKPSLFYMFTVLLSLGIFAFALFALTSVLNIPTFVIVILVVIVIFGFFVSIVNKLSSGMWEQRFQKLKTCENCGKTIPDEADVCPLCGHEYIELIKPEIGVLCDSCGHINRNNETQCEKCNEFLK